MAEPLISLAELERLALAAHPCPPDGCKSPECNLARYILTKLFYTCEVNPTCKYEWRWRRD